ncbi:MAG: sulfatase, partial [Gemmatimonadaceae bacterium]
ILDTVRADALSAYGYARSTSPFIDSLAARGVRFTHAVATAPWTLPTHASILTGQYPHQTSVSWTTGLDGTHRTLAEVLASQGFRTGGFVANREYASSAVGLERGFQTFRDIGRGPRHLMATSSLWWWLTRSYNRLRNRNVLLNRRTAAEVNDDFLRWLDERPQAPFFAFLNYFDAHSPYTPPPPYDMKFADREPETRDLPFGGVPPTPEVTRQLRDAYDGGIAYIDAQIAQLWAELERRGVAGRTAVIVTSDHGEEFLEHGAVGHGSSLYWASVRVPLIVAQERCVPVATVTRTVSLRDLPQTILDLLGITSSEIPGHSLTRLWSDAPFQGELSPATQAVDTAANNTFDYPIAKGNMRAINGDDVRLVVNGDSSLELYRVRDDPLERAPLDAKAADSATARELLTTLRGVLALPTGPPAGTRITAARSHASCAVTP